jgi:hypothetical protein
MNKEGWPKFSFTELLKPPDGWRTDYAILSTYSADLVVIVTSLLAMSGCDLESRRTGSRVELVRAIEALRGRVRILAQQGRVVIPAAPVPILKLLDKFLLTIVTDEHESSFHPKAAFLRFQNLDDPSDRQWRIWLGSRNLTRALNWESGFMFVSRSDGKGQQIDGLPGVGEALAARAKLTALKPKVLRAELSKLTWECPPGCEIRRISILEPGLEQGFPNPPADTERMFIVSPFLDAKTVRLASGWGGPRTHRTLVSTDLEFQRLLRQDGQVFAGFENLCRQPLPDLPAERAAHIGEENHSTIEVAESEEAPPQGLHAKLLFAAKGKRRQLWLGSANATERGWQGRNVEIVSELAISQAVGEGIEAFVDTCERYTPVLMEPTEDKQEQELENARKALSGRWSVRQCLRDGALEIVGSAPPPILNLRITLDVAAMGGAWKTWPPNADRVSISNMREWERTDFIQMRVRLGDIVCGWLQVAPCDPPPDEQRDHGLIAQYLDPHTFLLWLRSLLADSAVEAAGDDWDSDGSRSHDALPNGAKSAYLGSMPTIEEILRAWARDSLAFRNADQKVKTYLTELERRAAEQEAPSDVELLQTLRKTWDTVAGELQ